MNGTRPLVGLCLVLALVMLGDSAMAASLPWESAMENLRDSLTGPVAVAIVLIAMVVAGGTLIFARTDLSEFAQRMVYIVLVFCIIMLATQVLETLFEDEQIVTATGGLLPVP